MSGGYRKPPAVIDPEALASLAGKPCVGEAPGLLGPQPTVTMPDSPEAACRRFHMGGDPIEPLPGMPTRAEIAADPVEREHRLAIAESAERKRQGAEPRECKACRARGSKRGLSMWEWRQWHSDGVGWPGQLPDHVAEDGGLGPRPWGVVRADGTGNVWQRACRPCPACNRYGMPTGVER